MGNLGAIAGYKRPQATTKEAPCRQLFHWLHCTSLEVGGWVLKDISVNSSGHKGWVYLRPDGRRNGFRCPKYKRRMGKIRERHREVLDLPLGTASVVHLVLTAYQGRCAHCGNIRTFRPPGIDAKAQGTNPFACLPACPVGTADSEEIPHAKIVCDKFHLIANYNGVTDKIRLEEWRTASKQEKTFIKGQRYNLFRNPENPCPVE